MTIVKSLAIVALLVGGASLAMAQNGPATGSQPPAPAASGPPGPGVIPNAPSPNLQSAAAPTKTSSGTRVAHQTTTKHHKKMYMSAKGTHHKAMLKDNSRMQTMPKQ
jgi:hypothetical protein